MEATAFATAAAVTTGQDRSHNCNGRQPELSYANSPTSTSADGDLSRTYLSTKIWLRVWDRVAGWKRNILIANVQSSCQ